MAEMTKALAGGVSPDLGLCGGAGEGNRTLTVSLGIVPASAVTLANGGPRDTGVDPSWPQVPLANGT